MKKIAPPELEVVPVNPELPVEEQVALCKDAEFMIAPDNTPLKLLKACPQLKLFQLLSAGYDRMDLPAVLELGIRVANNGGSNAIPVAEQAVTLMLSVLHRVRRQWESTKARKWNDGFIGQDAYDLADRTVGIVGFGNIGRQVARMLRGWQTTFLYYDIVEFPPEVGRELKAKPTSLEELLRASDVITLHMPHTRRTHHMIGEREFSFMKPTAILVNTCRGGVVDEAALIKALREKRIAGAGLDVFEKEPPDPDNPLLHMDNVLYTPHFGFASAEVMPRSAAFAFQNMLRVLKGEEPLSLVRPEE